MAVTTSRVLRFTSGIAATAMVLTGGALVATPAFAAAPELSPISVTAADITGEHGAPDKSAKWTKVNSLLSMPGRYEVLPHADEVAVLELETIGGPTGVGTATKVAHYFESGSYPTIDAGAHRVGNDEEATIPLAGFLADPVTLRFEAPTYISMQLEMYHGDGESVWLYQLAPVSPLWQEYDFNADANWFTYDDILDPSGAPYKIGTKEVKANTRISSLNDLIGVMAAQNDSLRLAGVGLNKGRDTNATAGGIVRISSFEFLGQEFTFAVAPTKPDAPVAALTSDGQVDVTWTAPADGGSAITGYTVTLTPTTGTSDPLVAAVGGDDTSHVFTELIAGVSYTATVAATNDAGTSAESDASNAVRANIQLCEDITDGGVSTNLERNGWGFSGTRATGHNDYVDGGLHVWTESNNSTDKAIGYKTITPLPLSQLGEPSVEFADFEGTRPSMQLRVSKTGSALGGNIVVGEPWAYGEWMWWSSTDFGVGGGMGYASFGTLAEFMMANPAAKVNQIGYSLGSGVKGDATITSMTFGCVKYAFDGLVAGSAEITGTPAVGETLTATGTWDPSDADLSYAWKAGGTAIPGATDSTFMITAAQVGEEITVTVTGTSGELRPATETSAPTTEVTWDAEITRITGKDRYATAINISKTGFSSADIVFVATGQDYPDALSAAPVAAEQDGPLLLTLKNSLPKAVANEINRLKPSKIVVVGGYGAVSAKVLNELAKIAPTQRVSGKDRYATSRNINNYGFSAAATAYVATGQVFPDALSASAAGAAVGAPVILVNGSASVLDAATTTQLDSLGVTQTIIAGGKGAVSAGIAAGLKTATGTTADRRGGSDRYETSRLIGKDVFAPAKSVYLATGVEFPDALAGAVLAGKNKGPLYLVQQNCVPNATLADITSAAPTAITLFGGTGALSSNVYNLKACK